MGVKRRQRESDWYARRSDLGKVIIESGGESVPNETCVAECTLIMVCCPVRGSGQIVSFAGVWSKKESGKQKNKAKSSP